MLAGGVIAYPTEAVFGLGCLPEQPRAPSSASSRSNAARGAKGSLLIGSTWYSSSAIVVLPPEPRRSEVIASWPGPVTWVLPATPHAPRWISGGRDSVAVRLTDHPLARALCAAVGQRARVDEREREPADRRCATLRALRRELGRSVDYVLAGALGGLAQPTVDQGRPDRDGPAPA